MKLILLKLTVLLAVSLLFDKSHAAPKKGLETKRLEEESIIKTLPDPPTTRPGDLLSEYTFKELNILSDELVLKGLSPRYDFLCQSTLILLRLEQLST
ncbi:MAG: hypothetical protein NZL90_02905 [Aquificaceae bacterium]|nr:hypothetical protein [Aquificaceae bacterium]